MKVEVCQIRSMAFSCNEIAFVQQQQATFNYPREIRGHSIPSEGFRRYGQRSRRLLFSSEKDGDSIFSLVPQK